jgi:hypothetical protein
VRGEPQGPAARPCSAGGRWGCGRCWRRSRRAKRWRFRPSGAVAVWRARRAQPAPNKGGAGSATRPFDSVPFPKVRLSSARSRHRFALAGPPHGRVRLLRPPRPLYRGISRPSDAPGFVWWRPPWRRRDRTHGICRVEPGAAPGLLPSILRAGRRERNNRPSDLPGSHGVLPGRGPGDRAQRSLHIRDRGRKRGPTSGHQRSQG